MSIDLGDEQDEPAPVEELERLAEIVLTSEGLDDGTSVAITLVDESRIAELNETHMGKAGPTDVLSFPIEDAAPGEPPRGSRDGPPLQLGDVFIAPSVVRANAKARSARIDVNSTTGVRVCEPMSLEVPDRVLLPAPDSLAVRLEVARGAEAHSSDAG